MIILSLIIDRLRIGILCVCLCVCVCLCACVWLSRVRSLCPCSLFKNNNSNNNNNQIKYIIHYTPFRNVVARFRPHSVRQRCPSRRANFENRRQTQRRCRKSNFDSTFSMDQETEMYFTVHSWTFHSDSRIERDADAKEKKKQKQKATGSVSSTSLASSVERRVHCQPFVISTKLGDRRKISQSIRLCTVDPTFLGGGVGTQGRRDVIGRRSLATTHRRVSWNCNVT